MKLVFPSVIPLCHGIKAVGGGGGGGGGYARSLQRPSDKWTACLNRFCGFLNGDMSLKNHVMRCRGDADGADLIGSPEEDLAGLLVPLDWAAPSPVSDVKPVSPGGSRLGKQTARLGLHWWGEPVRLPCRKRELGSRNLSIRHAAIIRVCKQLHLNIYTYQIKLYCHSPLICENATQSKLIFPNFQFSWKDKFADLTLLAFPEVLSLFFLRFCYAASSGSQVVQPSDVST